MADKHLPSHAQCMHVPLEKSTPAAQKAEPVRWWNGCDKSVPDALRFLANNERPSGGEQSYNAAHLFQLADEIEYMAKMPLYALAQAAREPVPERLRVAFERRDLVVPSTLDEAIKTAANVLCEDGTIIAHLKGQPAREPITPDLLHDVIDALTALLPPQTDENHDGHDARDVRKWRALAKRLRGITAQAGENPKTEACPLNSIYEPCGPNDEMQCKYCGSAPKDGRAETDLADPVVSWRDLKDGEIIEEGDRLLSAGRAWVLIAGDAAHLSGRQYDSSYWWPVQRQTYPPRASHSQTAQALAGELAVSVHAHDAEIDSQSAREPVKDERMARKAARFEWLLANCVKENDKGLLCIHYESARHARDHSPDVRAYWFESDIASDSKTFDHDEDHDAYNAAYGITAQTGETQA